VTAQNHQQLGKPLWNIADDILRHGQGIWTISGGNSLFKYEAAWLNDSYHGQGTETYANGRKYVGDLVKAADGTAKIPASAIRVRCAVPATAGKSWAPPGRFDGLIDQIPAEIPAYLAPTATKTLAPLWLTVRVPATVLAGRYEGRITIAAQGFPAQTVPLQVQVCDWSMPDVLKKIKARGWLDETTLGYNAWFASSFPTLVDVAHRLWPGGEWSFTGHNGSQDMLFLGSDANLAMIVRHSDTVYVVPRMGAQTAPKAVKIAWADEAQSKIHMRAEDRQPLWLLDGPRRNTFTFGCRMYQRYEFPLNDMRLLAENYVLLNGFDGLGDFGANLYPLKKPAGGYYIPPAGPARDGPGTTAAP
jgi:hypothetical protein